MNELVTERLVVRPFKFDDLDQAHQLLDADLNWSGPSFSRDQRRRRLQFYIDLAEWSDTGRIYGYRAIILKELNELIGVWGFLPCLWSDDQKSLFGRAFDHQPRSDRDNSFSTLELEVGYALSSAHRGKGYATEAVRALIDHAFRELRVGRVIATTDRGNVGSANLMRRVGMTTVITNDPNVTYPFVVGIIDNKLTGATGLTK